MSGRFCQSAWETEDELTHQMDDPVPPRRLIVLDFEASALPQAGSFPVEVGICWADTAEVRTWLIRPTSDWLASGLWSAASAAVHGIGQQEAFDLGLPVRQVAMELAAAVAGCEVLSDCPAADGFWLKAIYDAAGLGRPPFRLHDVFGLFSALAGDHRYRIITVLDEARKRHPPTHRAGPDARCVVEAIRLLAAM